MLIDKFDSEKAGIAPLLDVEDMVEMSRPDWKCVFVYVQSIYRRFRNCQWNRKRRNAEKSSSATAEQKQKQKQTARGGPQQQQQLHIYSLNHKQENNFITLLSTSNLVLNWFNWAARKFLRFLCLFIIITQFFFLLLLLYYYLLLNLKKKKTMQ